MCSSGGFPVCSSGGFPVCRSGGFLCVAPEVFLCVAPEVFLCVAPEVFLCVFPEVHKWQAVSCVAPWKTVNAFIYSVMKVNTSLNADLKISLKCCWKCLVFRVRFHTFFSTTSLHATTVQFSYARFCTSFGSVMRGLRAPIPVVNLLSSCFEVL